MVGSNSFPVFHLDSLKNSRSRRGASTELLAGLEHYGFVGVVCAGIDRVLLDEVYAAGQRVFALPENVKSAYEKRSTRGMCGYSAFPPEGEGALATGWKESWNFGPFGAPITGMPENFWPAEVPVLRAPMIRLHDALTDCATTLLEASAEALNLSPNYFSSMTTGAYSVLRLMNYPRDSERRFLLREHEDLSMLTLLCPPTEDGLEFQGRDGGWIHVAGGGEAVIVNVGQMLAHLSGGRLRSAIHRVRAVGSTTDRQSIPYFVNARSDADFTIPRHLRAAGDYEDLPLTAGEFFLEKVKLLEGATK